MINVYTEKVTINAAKRQPKKNTVIKNNMSDQGIIKTGVTVEEFVEACRKVGRTGYYINKNLP